MSALRLPSRSIGSWPVRDLGIPSVPVPALDADPGDDDAAIVARALQDRTAFAPLYQRYLDPVYRYCYRRLGSVEAAEDAASLVFARVLQALPAYRGGCFRAWLFTIAHNVVTDAYRRHHSVASLTALTDLADPRATPDELALQAEEAWRVRAALSRLAVDQRQVIELRLAGLSTAEAATTLHRTPGAVRALQLRALRRLQALLGEPPAEENHDGG
jgi:RNA polymerase sigma-70 factor, ECF subfamily